MAKSKRNARIKVSFVINTLLVLMIFLNFISISNKDIELWRIYFFLISIFIFLIFEILLVKELLNLYKK